MSESESNRRIKFAYHLFSWSYEDGDKSLLRKTAERIIPSDFRLEMDGDIFCPGCYTNLNRIPKEKDHFKNGREAYFSHHRRYTNISCDLKSTKPEGKRYDSFEEAQKAIDDENLVIVSGFLKEKPEIVIDSNSEYNETPVEDIAGPLANVPIARHNGESFTLPSKVTTVNGICRNFDENLYKYYYFPNQSNAIRLIDLLHDIRNVSEETTTPKLYYGRIISTTHLGEYKRPDNIRMTYLSNNQPEVADFCLKLPHKEQESHGIGDKSGGRIVIVYGVVKESGVGLCFNKLGWGEFALLPEKYGNLLENT